ncbi:MAG: hypothetical protein CL662_07810 [Bacteroidetes bacterium]|nr:hypothetical protein [Bacteroidota bacterium]
MKIKHSKYKNTGLLFELLVRRITSDTLSGKPSPASVILKKYFVNTELGKEYKLYESFFSKKGVSEVKASTTISIILESSKKLNKQKLRKEKYNLIKELKQHYNIEDIFKTKISEYKEIASLYKLIECYNSDLVNNPNELIDIKVNLMEYLTESSVDKDKVADTVLEEFGGYDKDLRVLTYKILLEKFNSKYSELNSNQKRILREYINSIDSTSYLKEFYNKEVAQLHIQLTERSKTINDKVLKIKLDEVKKFLTPLSKTDKVSSENLVDLLQFYSLTEKLN